MSAHLPGTPHPHVIYQLRPGLRGRIVGVSSTVEAGICRHLVIHRPGSPATVIHRFRRPPYIFGSHPQCLDMRHDTVIDDLLATEGVVLLRDHLELQSSLCRGVRSGRLARVLPGVYVDAGSASDVSTRIAAVTRWDPNAVICGRAAASLTYWPKITVGKVEVASPTRHAEQPGFEFTKRWVPPEFVLRGGGMQVSSPSLTAIELASLEFTDPIDIALLERQATLESLTAALHATPQRAGNRQRWKVLLDSRAEPWSAAERLAHRLYWKAGINGWVTNRKTIISEWVSYYIDVAFEKQRVASEIDGKVHLRDAKKFEDDRYRQNALVLNGWLVLRFTWKMLTENPDYVVQMTRQALELRDRNPPRPGLR